MDTTTFVNQLRDCGLLFDKRLDKSVRELAGQSPDAKTLARTLMQRGLLTPYQANYLLTGKGKELVLGQYRIVERIGHNVTGQIFKAVHATMGRLVVIRLMAPHLAADPSERARFMQEVQNIAQLSHTNILTAFDAFETDGRYVLVMEYVEGMDLVALVEHVGPLPVQLACNFLRQTALGLQHAFERGIKHCDIKPENILIAGYQTKGKGADASASSAVPRGVVKILNLGLAQIRETTSAQTGSRTAIRPSTHFSAADCFAPELAQNLQAADIRSDVYGMGCILYFALAGKPPFPDGSPNEKISAHQSKEPTPLEQLRPDVPARLVAIVRRMMAKKPAERFQTPAEAASELMPFCVIGAAAKR